MLPEVSKAVSKGLSPGVSIGVSRGVSKCLSRAMFNDVFEFESRGRTIANDILSCLYKGVRSKRANIYGQSAAS